MERQALFDRHVAELIDISTNRRWDEYALLRSAAIVRALLLDDSPLIHQVNRERQERLLFSVQITAISDEVLADKPYFYSRGSGLSPRLAITAGSTVTLKLDPFLKFQVAMIAGQDVDVRAAVKYLANVEGGVHPGTAKSELEKRLAEINKVIGLNGVGLISTAMQGIADVVATACVPLTS